jgi:hypothetical protein
MGQPELSADRQSWALAAHNRPSAAQFANRDAIGPRPTVTSTSPLGQEEKIRWLAALARLRR